MHPTDTHQEVRKSLERFNRIDLDGLTNTLLLNRWDSKCWFHAEQLCEILTAIAPHYHLLWVGDRGIQNYRTTYYDTSKDTYYLDHHNRRARRTKVRKREYIGSHLSFLEVKQRTNKGRTQKRRMEIPNCSEHMPEPERAFLKESIEQVPAELETSIQNSFERITLVHTHLPERCTIDIDLSFSRGAHQSALKNLAVIELKHGRRGIRSELVQVLKERHIPFIGFSKYCIGRALLEPSLKQNRLKASLLKIQKLSA